MGLCFFTGLAVSSCPPRQCYFITAAITISYQAQGPSSNG